MLNKDVFDKNPLNWTIPNDGYAQVAEPKTAEQFAVLKWELETFVCKGAYEDGLLKILNSYLRSHDQPVQPAVWISGFYGSGKSHLARVLEFIWRDMPMPDGSTTRSIAKLTDDIKDRLKELSVIGKREGGLWSAAGTLGSAARGSVRMALLGVLLRAADLPASFAEAQFVLWLRERGWYDHVKSTVEAGGDAFDAQVRRMYVSPSLAHALLRVNPDFATSVASVGDRLESQFPPRIDDISEDDLLATMNDILSLKSNKEGKLPCTLVVLDELQQFVGDDIDRSTQLGLSVEKCVSRFKGQLLFVGTGQSALEVSGQLAKLKDRFTVKVGLSSTDVESVVREVVLRKKESASPAVRQILDKSAGEIDRHLRGTKLSSQPSDRNDMVADYPLLPVRRRFWERALRAVDAPGAAGQLRTQLRVTLEAVKEVADRPLGTVVPADRVFFQEANSMEEMGVLLADTHATIVRLERDGPLGVLASRACAVIFLINRITRDESPGAGTGLRSTAEMVADLLVEDLTVSSATFRLQVARLLEDLAESGTLMKDADTYLLQTKEGQEWERDRRIRFQRIMSDAPRIAADRSAELRTAAAKALEKLSFPHGVTRTPRKIELHFGADTPAADVGAIPVWGRDEWSVSEKNVRDDARIAGLDSPLVLVFLPKRSPDELDRQLAEIAAAGETLSGRTDAQTAEGVEARRSMESRLSTARERVGAILAEIVSGARVFQGGGGEVAEGSLRASVESAAANALVRLFPQFSDADIAGWDTVIKRAKQGNLDALSSVGYTADPAQHPVVRQIVSFIGLDGSKGLAVRRHFTAPPYGWSQDAVDGSLFVALAGNILRAMRNGVQATVATVDQSNLGQVEFRAENIVVGMTHRLACRSLLNSVGISFKSNEEELALPRLIQELIALAEKCGGPPPMLAVPPIEHLEDMQTRSGNDLIFAVWQNNARLTNEFNSWSDISTKASMRRKEWDKLEALIRYAKPLEIYQHVSTERDAIITNRSLLIDPDPVATLIQQLSTGLRAAIQEVRQRHLDNYGELMATLEDDSTWQRLSPTQMHTIKASRNLGPLPNLKVSTDDELLAALSETSLTAWDSLNDALQQRVTSALHDAVKLLEPSSVHVRVSTKTLKTAEEAHTFVADLEQQILDQINAGHPVIVGA